MLNFKVYTPKTKLKEGGEINPEDYELYYMADRKAPTFHSVYEELIEGFLHTFTKENAINNIVEINNKFIIIENNGFKYISFDPSNVSKSKKYFYDKAITTILVPVGTKPKVLVIENTLEGKQETVGGMIDCKNISYENGRYIDIVLNDEEIDLELNRAVRDEDGKPYDIVAGDFLIAAYNCEGEAVSLSEAEVSKYTELYQYPEMFFRTPKGIIVINFPKEDIRNA